jgi:hypothetical protein
VVEFEGFRPLDIASLPLDPATGKSLVGRVNGVPLTLEDLTSRVRRLRFVSRLNVSQPGQGDNRRIEVMPGVMASTENEARMVLALTAPAFDMLVEQVLVREMATSQGLHHEPIDLTARIAEVNRNRPAGWKIQDELFAAGRTLNDLRLDLEVQDLEAMLLDRIEATEVKPATAGQLQEFMRRPDVFTSTTRVVVRARHIAIPLEPDASEARVAAARRIAEQALAEFEAGTSWSVLVERHSRDLRTRHRAGDLGWIAPEDMDPAFAAALKRLEVMGYPEIVRTSRGIHLVQVTDRAVGDAQIHWRHMEAQRILRERKQEYRQKSRIERYIP